MIEIALAVTLLMVVVLYCYTWVKTSQDFGKCVEMSKHYKQGRDALSEALKDANAARWADLEKIDSLTKERDGLLTKLEYVRQVLDEENE